MKKLQTKDVPPSTNHPPKTEKKMNLTFIDVREVSGNKPVISVSISGLMMLNKSAASLLNADKTPFLKFGNSLDKKDISLYLQIFPNGGDGCFEIRKVKMGYVINRCVGLLNHVGIDFKNYAYKFIIESIDSAEMIFILKEVSSKKRDNKN